MLTALKRRRTIVRTDLPEAGEVIAALPLLDVRRGHMVDQVFLLSELTTAIAPLAHKHAGALSIFFLISLIYIAILGQREDGQGTK